MATSHTASGNAQPAEVVRRYPAFWSKEDSWDSLSALGFGKMFSLGDELGLQPPLWVTQYLGENVTANLSTKTSPSGASYLTRLIKGEGNYGLLSLIIRDVPSLSSDDLQAAAYDLYQLIPMLLEESSLGFPIRFWNFFPGINDKCVEVGGVVQDRYMFFNAGRSLALEKHFGSYEQLGQLICTATGIGNDSATCFTLHCLAHTPGVQVENPRQVPAYKYSKKYGVRAPSFSRATLVPHPLDGETKRLFITAGTASILGEDTVHLDDPVEQTHETLRNLTTLLKEAMARVVDECSLSPEAREEMREEVGRDMKAWPKLGLYYSSRIYVKHPEHLECIADIVTKDAHPNTRLEFVQATVCRPNLLVEIECVAEIDAVRCKCLL